MHNKKRAPNKKTNNLNDHRAPNVKKIYGWRRVVRPIYDGERNMTHNHRAPARDEEHLEYGKRNVTYIHRALARDEEHLEYGKRNVTYIHRAPARDEEHLECETMVNAMIEDLLRDDDDQRCSLSMSGEYAYKRPFIELAQATAAIQRLRSSCEIAFTAEGVFDEIRTSIAARTTAIKHIHNNCPQLCIECARLIMICEK